MFFSLVFWGWFYCFELGCPALLVVSFLAEWYDYAKYRPKEYQLNGLIVRVQVAASARKVARKRAA